MLFVPGMPLLKDTKTPYKNPIMIRSLTPQLLAVNLVIATGCRHQAASMPIAVKKKIVELGNKQPLFNHAIMLRVPLRMLNVNIALTVVVLGSKLLELAVFLPLTLQVFEAMVLMAVKMEKLKFQKLVEDPKSNTAVILQILLDPATSSAQDGIPLIGLKLGNMMTALETIQD